MHRFVFALLLLAGGSLACAPFQTKPTQTAVIYPTCQPHDAACRVEQVRDEALGGIRPGMSETDLIAAIGNPGSRKGPFDEAATGLMIEYWDWNAEGITVDMASEGIDKPRTVARVVLRAPCALTTERGVAVGAGEQDVIEAYATLADPDFSVEGEKLVVGSIYEGMIFTFVRGRVTTIFLGSGAE